MNSEASEDYSSLVIPSRFFGRMVLTARFRGGSGVHAASELHNSKRKQARVRMSDKGYQMAITLFIFCCVAVFGFSGQTLIKSGLNQAAGRGLQGFDWVLGAYLNGRVMLGTVLVGFGFLLWVAVLSRLELSQAMPLLAVTYIPWLVIARVSLKENVTVAQWVGAVLISIGVFLVLRK